MFWLNWRFALIAVSFAPIVLLVVMRFRKSAKQAIRILRASAGAECANSRSVLPCGGTLAPRA